MRTEQEMFELILGIAEQDARIRAVYMNGSRSNSNVKKDIFQDYDIVYVVTETKPFYEDENWIDCFGPRLYMQMPEKMELLRGRVYDFDAVYCWLIQLADGNRVDLHVQSIPFSEKHILEDKLCLVLLDKDNILPEIPPSTDEDYHVKRPSEADFQCDCNNFWWCLNNVAKGLFREEVPYVMDMLHEDVRLHLIHMLSWKIGIHTNFSVSVGKSGKYMGHFLPHETWQRFLKTYSDANVENIWSATFILCDLFNEVATDIAERLGYIYNQEEANASRRYLEHVHRLPKDAKEVFSGGGSIWN